MRPIYGLDIETDTRVDAFDPSVAAVLAVAISTADGDQVFDGPEDRLLAALDDAVRALPPGVLATWNGSMFDLPFLADRAAAAGVPFGLVLRPDRRVPASNRSIEGHQVAYAASWHAHTHLDTYRLYRPVRLALGVSAGLKNVAGLLGYAAVEADASRVHELDADSLRAYVASDARLTRLLAERRWDRAAIALDELAPAAS